MTTYLDRYPRGAHAKEAAAARDEGRPRLDRIAKDHAQWGDADVGRCREERTQSACEGVELYVTKFGDGLHASEARDLLRRRASEAAP